MKPGTYGPGRGEAPLCNMHGMYLKAGTGACKGCEDDRAAVEAVTAQRIADWHEQRGIESREIAWIAASRDLGHVAGIAYVDAETHDNAAERIRAGEYRTESPTENEDT